jgi:maleate isomerase
LPTTWRSAPGDPRAPIEISQRLNTANCDAVVLSACAQMPALASIQPVEDRLGIPVLLAAVRTTHQMLHTLGLKTVAPHAGAWLSGRY